MGSTFRPIFSDDAVTFRRDTTSSLTAAALTATNMQYCGSPTWTISIPQALTATVQGDLTAQANMSNFLESASIPGTAGAVAQWSYNPLLNQPALGTQKRNKINPSFVNNWVDVAVLSAGRTLLAVSNTPVRFVRLAGLGLTAANFVAFLWTEDMNSPN